MWKRKGEEKCKNSWLSQISRVPTMWRSLKIFQWFRKNLLAIRIRIRQKLTTIASRWWIRPHVTCSNWRKKLHPHIREKIRVHRVRMANVKCRALPFHCRLRLNLKLSWAIVRWSLFIVSSKISLGKFQAEFYLSSISRFRRDDTAGQRQVQFC